MPDHDKLRDLQPAAPPPKGWVPLLGVVGEGGRVTLFKPRPAKK